MDGIQPRTLWYYSFLLLCLLLCAVIQPSQARELVDMSGATVHIPENVSKVYSVSPPGTYLLYAFDPKVIAGLNFPLRDSEQKFLSPVYRELPVIGGIVGQGRSLNREILLLTAPDLLLVWRGRDNPTTNKFEQSLNPLPFPRVSVCLDSLLDYPDAIQLVAQVLNMRERGDALYAYTMATLKKAKHQVETLSENEKVRVYYAEGPDGLATEPRSSWHVELIEMAGGVNVHVNAENTQIGMGMEKISMEQILNYDPDCILVKEKEFYARIFTDPRWQSLSAVKNRRVYLIPSEPFNWFDRPPSFMRFLGLKWLINVFYPNRFQTDMLAETKQFYDLFLGVKLSDSEAKELLNI